MDTIPDIYERVQQKSIFITERFVHSVDHIDLQRYWIITNINEKKKKTKTILLLRYTYESDFYIVNIYTVKKPHTTHIVHD